MKVPTKQRSKEKTGSKGQQSSRACNNRISVQRARKETMTEYKENTGERASSGYVRLFCADKRFISAAVVLSSYYLLFEFLCISIFCGSYYIPVLSPPVNKKSFWLQKLQKTSSFCFFSLKPSPLFLAKKRWSVRKTIMFLRRSTRKPGNILQVKEF